MNKIVNELEPFKYGNLIGLFIQITGLAFVWLGVFYFFGEERVTYFARISSIFVGLLMTIVGKVILAIMQKYVEGKFTFFKFLVNLLDGFSWTGIVTILGYEILSRFLNVSENVLWISVDFIALAIFGIVILVNLFVTKSRLVTSILVLHICIATIPFRLIFIFVKKEYRLFVTVVTVASILLVTMILL